MDDKTFTLDTVPHEFDLKEAMKLVGGKARPGHRKLGKFLHSKIEQIQESLQKSYDELKQLQSECVHPANDIIVKVIYHTDDWAKSTWAEAYMQCGLCAKYIKTPDDKKFTWHVSSW
jgi:hypothetical protein